MATKKNRQSYVVSNVGFQSVTSGRQSTSQGRYAGGRQGATQVNADGTKSQSYGGKMISRNQRYRDVRRALGMSAG